jgi:hypothetical protein
MPLMPVMLNGSLRLVNMPASAGAKEQFEAEVENARRAFVHRRRLYYGGEQYLDENLETMSALGLNPLSDRLPEHERKHAYSTQVGESIDFIADQLAGEFSFEAEDASAQKVLEDAMRASDQFSGPNDDDEIAVDDVLRDALVAGDVPVEIRWDPILETVFYDCWESEQFRWESRGVVEKVIRTEVVWVEAIEGQKQVVERVEYDLAPNESGVLEARKQVFFDEEEEPEVVEFLGLPFVPWVLVMGDKKKLRSPRGESLITDQAMQAADRYNATEQIGFLIAKYNSHGNLAVIGDAASLEARQEERISKDVADVLTFPGGTALQTITLSGDTAMLEQQRTVLADSIFEAFGLTRVDPDTIGYLGGVSGYALEILNRKTEGTFRRVRRQFVQSLRALFAMTLDVTAYRQNATVTDLDGNAVDLETLPEDVVVQIDFASVDPQAVYANRQIEVRLGSGYIVDDVMVRDDYVAGLISRAEALRQRGRTDDDIKKIEDEIEAEAPPEPEIGVFKPTGGNGKQKAGGTVAKV